MEIVIGPDENYAMACGVLITSILYTNPGNKIRFHIISEYLSEKTKARLKECLKNTESVITFYTIDPALLEGLPSFYGSFATYTILFIANILPVEIEKVIYLDVDMIAVNSLDKLWSIDISDYPAAGAMAQSYDDIRIYNRLGYDSQKGYYNIGTQIINLVYWRQYNIMRECLNIIQNNPNQLILPDQDVLNMVLMGKWKMIHPQYNCFINYYSPIDEIHIRKEFHEEIKYARIHPIVIHFNGRPKPWHKEFEPSLVKIWLFFKQKSPWKKDKLKCYSWYTLWKLRIKNIMTTFHLRKKSAWNDPLLDMPAVIENILEQAEKARMSDKICLE